MTIVYPSTIIYIDTNPQDENLARAIPVCIEYCITVDQSYGEDTDGQQGATLVEYEIMDAFIEADVLKCISAELAEWAIENARHIFHSSKKHHA